MIQTFKENKFEILRDKRTCKSRYHAIGSPSIETFKAILKRNLIKNSPVTIADVNIAERNYGPSNSTFKGKTTGQTQASYRRRGGNYTRTPDN